MSQIEKVIPCPNCGKMTIKTGETPKSFSCKRGFTGKKGLYLYKGHTTILTKVCPECKMKYGEHKEIDHEARIRRMQEQGIPTRIEE